METSFLQLKKKPYIAQGYLKLHRKRKKKKKKHFPKAEFEYTILSLRTTYPSY